MILFYIENNNVLECDEKFMQAAIREALAASDEDEVPVGAVVVHQGRIIGRGYNQRERLQDPTAHAEMIALTAAASALSSWRLEACTMYVTLEPCPMCAGAIVQSRLPRLVFGARDPKAGACVSLYSITQDERLNHYVDVVGDVMARDCGAMLTDFFANQRSLGKK